MAKTGKRPGQPVPENEAHNAGAVENNAPNGPMQQTLVDLAEDLGRLLGTAEQKATMWMGDRQEIATRLTEIRDTCNSYLQELTGGGAALADALQRGRRAETPAADTKTEPDWSPGSPSAEDTAGGAGSSRKRSKVTAEVGKPGSRKR